MLNNTYHSFSEKLINLHHKVILKIQKRTPILLYQMGKVGSTSVEKSLKEQNLKPVFHVHRMNKENILKVRKEHIEKSGRPQNEDFSIHLYNEYILKKKKVKIITLVREPISRNISAYFQNYKIFIGNDRQLNKKKVDGLIESFLAEYPHNVPLDWFDIEMKTTTGIDVYKYEFPKEKGWQIIEENNIKLLLIKSEISDSNKQKAINEFMGMDNFKLNRCNVGSKKVYSDLYSDFKTKIIIPDDYKKRMLESKYTKHFYSNAEIENIMSKYS